MDDLQLLRDRYDALPGPSDETTAAARTRLLDHAARPAHFNRIEPRRAVRRRYLIPAGLGLAAASVAVGLVMTSGTAPVTAPKPSATVTLSASQVLLAAATQVESKPATGRYLHSVDRNTVLVSLGTPGHPFLVVETRISESWTARLPKKDSSYSWYQGERTGPWTDADAEAWQKAGSPSVLPSLHSKNAFLRIRGSSPVRPYVAKAGTKQNMDAGILGEKEVTVADIQRLPADPSKLKKYLLTMYHGQAGPEVSESGRTDLWLFSVARDLVLGFFPASQAVRAAAYRMLASVEGIKVISSVKAPDGTPGTGIAITETQKKRGVVEHRLIIDPKTGRMLAMQEVAAKPAANLEGVPPGTIYAQSVYLTDEWTDATPRKTF
jgi:hypothetical protein